MNQPTNFFSKPKDSLNKTYQILSGDSVVAMWENHDLKIINKDLAPLYLVNFGDFVGWLTSRAIDKHRTNSRLLKKALRLRDYDDISTVLSVNAQTITDNYWVKEADADLTYSDIIFSNDIFSDLALTGSYDSFNLATQKSTSLISTPELTNIGSYEKAWKLYNNSWYLCKQANLLERFSEVFISKLGLSLGLNMAQYWEYDSYTVTKDFTEGIYNYEPAYSFMLDNDDYSDTVNELKTFNNENLVLDFIRLVYLDTLVANPDRHTFNFGILRSQKTGKIISLAPNFDNNMALFARGVPTNLSRKNDLLIALFKELINHYPEYKSQLPKLSTEHLASLLSKETVSNEIKQAVLQFVYSAYSQI